MKYKNKSRRLFRGMDSGFKSIFAKYYTVMSMIIVISFIAMGGMMMIISTRYWVTDKKKLMSENTQAIAEITQRYTTRSALTGDYMVSEAALLPYIDLMASTTDSYVLLTNSAGDIIIGSSNAASLLSKTKVSDNVISRIGSQGFFEVGKLDGLLPTRFYTSATPVMDGQTAFGYVFVSASAAGLSGFLYNNFQVYMLSAFGVLMLTFVALYLLTMRLVRPLRQMATAARNFGVGDFSYRIPVYGKDEVAELASSLNNMAVSLSSVEEMRRSFIANVSHELKTPMTTIAGFVDGILDGTIPENRRHHYLEIVSAEVKRLSRLVTSMLNLSRIDNGELRLNPACFDLTEQVCNVLLTLEHRINEKHINVEGLESCERADVVADYDLVGQVVYNLVDNAIKFINPEGTLTIRTAQKDNRVYFTIRNTGAGISSKEMPLIFDRFYKSDTSRSLDKNGMGIGLYIVKTILNQHHGEIVVRSVQGEYCEFEFWLPAAKM